MIFLTRYEHEIQGAHLDEVTMEFTTGPVPTHRRVGSDRLHPQVLPALLAHITGSSDGPVFFLVTGFTAASAGELVYAVNSSEPVALVDGRLTIEITMHRMAPSSPERLTGKTPAQDGYLKEIQDYLEGVR